MVVLKHFIHPEYGTINEVKINNFIEEKQLFKDDIIYAGFSHGEFVILYEDHRKYEERD